MNIFRTPTSDELRDFSPIMMADGKVETPEDKFIKKLSEEQQKAIKKGLPFAAQAAKAEWKEYFKNEAEKQLKKYGFVKEDIVPYKIDWDRYSNLANFDLLDENYKVDDNLSKRVNKQVNIRYKTYQFKGYYQKYTVMEDGVLAVDRTFKEDADKEADRIEKRRGK